ncbi:MAG: 4-(cytidine 5'-diphospho)-2-C-methyl-D-erythritol kinase [Clostridia bacterium]|nr:4-(cytidine 5'-diphospho)-2-C-methyl-D-erythritol kinase [Clostridia bacterium]
MRKVTIQAYAKINLYLDITGSLDGGYHALDTVMASVSCADFVTVGVRDDGDITVRMDGAACGEENTAYRAAKLVADRVGAGIDVNIVKRIPYSAGLGGSSADSAAVLSAAKKLFDIPQCELDDMALLCGSDVAYMMRGGFMRAKGRGEKLSEIDGLDYLLDKHLVVVQLCEGASTGAIYGEYDSLRIQPHGGADEAIERLKAGDVKGAVFNCLTVPAAKLCPTIVNSLYTLKSYSDTVAMTGSGSSVYAVFDNIFDAKKCYDEMKGFKYKGLLHFV